jgi:hypothetical protein
LKCLRLGWCKNLTDQGVQSLASLTSLSVLDLSLTDISCKSCDDLLQIIGPRLEVLDLSATNIFQHTHDSKEAIRLSFSKMRRLSTLKLLFCQQLTPALLEHIVQSAVSLKHLDVKHSGPEGSVTILPKLAMNLCNRQIQVDGAKFRRA